MGRVLELKCGDCTYNTVAYLGSSAKGERYKLAWCPSHEEVVHVISSNGECPWCKADTIAWDESHCPACNGSSLVVSVKGEWH